MVTATVRGGNSGVGRATPVLLAEALGGADMLVGNARGAGPIANRG